MYLYICVSIAYFVMGWVLLVFVPNTGSYICICIYVFIHMYFDSAHSSDHLSIHLFHVHLVPRVKNYTWRPFDCCSDWSVHISRRDCRHQPFWYRKLDRSAELVLVVYSTHTRNPRPRKCMTQAGAKKREKDKTEMEDGHGDDNRLNFFCFYCRVSALRLVLCRSRI